MAKQKKQRKAHISFGRVFFPALALLLPLIYLFTDAFILYSEALFVGGEGETLLARLIAQLSDAAFAANPVFDLIGVTYGGAEPLFEILTVFDVLSAGGEYASLLAPAWLICLTAVFSALCAVLILFTAGRILRVRAVADAVVIGGSLAAMAPFLADLSFRIYHVINGGFEAADLAIGQFSLSVELMLTLALSLCVVLPAVRALRRAAGGDGVYVTFPYRVASKLPTLARLLSLVLGAVAAVIPFVLFVVPACSAGTLYDALSNALGYFGDDFLSRIDLFGGTPIAVVADAVAALLHLALLIFMLLALVRAALRVLRVFFTGAHRVAVKKRVRRKFTRAGGVWRKPALHVLRCYIAIAVVAVLLTLFGTPMRAHVDFASVSDTLTLVYLVIAWAKAYCKLLSAGVMLCALSLALATVAGNLSRAFVSRAIEDHREENE
ncbi:MAG: hypothetical protein IJW51_05365 [Clostridia bacterium]|nr:hypothetical protein [Clostridia bacterium]